MRKTDILNKLNKAEDINSTLNKIKIELGEKKHQILELKKNNEDIVVENNNIKIKLNDLFNEHDIQVEKHNQFETNSKELIASLTSKKKTYLPCYQ